MSEQRRRTAPTEPGDPPFGVALAEADPAPSLGDELGLWLADVSADALRAGLRVPDVDPDEMAE